MQTGPGGCFHLTYCTKVHPGRGWAQLFADLKKTIPPLQGRLCPDRPFGLGLRLSESESRELLARDNLSEFQDFLAAGDLYVFTLNGFPYGDLTGPAVKAGIFAPDWSQPTRLSYTLRLIDILARLLPAGMEGSISTVPLSYKAWVTPADDQIWSTITANLAAVAAALVRLKEREGKFIHLDLEPEPDGLLEKSPEVVDFYRRWLLPRGGELLAGRLGVGLKAARAHLQEHIQVCLDTCHMAVEYEDPAEMLTAYEAAGIRVGKVQITAGLKVGLPEEDTERARISRQLEPFTHSPYLHQVIGAGKAGRVQYADLGAALPALAESCERQWRIHYHMPLFASGHELLGSTQEETREVLQLLRERPFCRHLEIETYTWEWLPEGLKLPLLDSLEREYRWVLENLGEQAGV